jgi:hypothetical protein
VGQSNDRVSAAAKSSTGGNDAERTVMPGRAQINGFLYRVRGGQLQTPG